MDKFRNSSIPDDFNSIKLWSDDTLKIDVECLEDLVDLYGNIDMPPTDHMPQGYILSLRSRCQDMGDVNFNFLTNVCDGQFKFSTAIEAIDIEKNLIKSVSGKIYEFDEILAFNPNELVIELCAVFTFLGISHITNTPDIYLKGLNG